MIQVTASLLRYYLRHPSVALRHTGRAAVVFRDGGPAKVRALVRAKITALRGDLAQRQEALESREKLLSLARAARSNRDHLLATLQPFADDLFVLDIVHDPDERLRLVTRHLLKKFSLLDESYYSSLYLKGAEGIQPADHYMKYGMSNGLRPNEYFDPVDYISSYPDVVSWGMDPVIHYALFGWKEGRSAGREFDGRYYLEKNPDVAEAGMSPFVHFMAHGRTENRPPRPAGAAIAANRNKGTILIVSHDAELGGAQRVTQVFAKWLLDSSYYDVRIVAMRGGAFEHQFAEIAPFLNMTAYPEDDRPLRLNEFAGPDVRAIFLNSVASGDFLSFWEDTTTPVISFIHELPKLLRHYSDNLSLIKDRSKRIIAGSGAVRKALREEFGVDDDRLRTAHGFIETPSDVEPNDFDDKRAAKAQLGLDPDAFLITACGVLHWRKSPDKFIEVAERITAGTGRPAQFIWIGGGPDQDECEKMIADRGLEARVQITGYEPDIMRYLVASDLFLLPSEEDPFPLVCLYAATALNPVICFEDAGGMPELVANGCGRAVPFGDVGAMADAVRAYLDDDALRRKEGKRAREFTLTNHTVRSSGPLLLHHIREAAGLKPHASVVVPNYNYEKFLPERLQTIADQSFQDFEVILLDDKSSDGSVAVLEDWASNRAGTRVVVNEKNSGSPFAQWIKGMQLANSELVWVAEADDACEPELLATLLPTLEDRNVFLAHAKSVPVDEAGKPLGDYEDLYLNRIAPGRWARSYVATDHEEANEGLGIANCIPNASSVVFRAFDPEPEFQETVSSMKMCGDWLFYLRAMRGGLISYRHEPLNYHRRHGATVTAQTEGSMRYFDEFATIRSYVSDTYDLSEEARNKIRTFTEQDLDRFGITDAAAREKVTGPLVQQQAKALPSVLFVASDLSPGGGQMFMIRLANEWMRRGGRGVLLNVAQYPDHERVVEMVDTRVPLFNARKPEGKLTDLIERFDLDVVHSAMWWADRHVHTHLPAEKQVPWVITLHGCYETLLDNPAIDASFPKRIGDMLERAQFWVPTADKNRRVFETHGDPRAERRIDNGVEAEIGTPLPREQLGLRPSSTLLCLATRAIIEKGWFEAVELTTRLNKAGHDVELMLIGDGPAADEIRHQAPDNVHLYGQVSNLKDFLATADIGLLPSTFIGESMPLVLLEMMAQSKPVIATDVGEIPELIGEESEAGGVTVPLKNGKVDMDGFEKAITGLLDESRRAKVGDQARKRFEERYTISMMGDRYEDLYREALAYVAKQQEATP